ncbi:MAG: GNAT family N-acetyltransferase [Nocardioides sp.]
MRACWVQEAITNEALDIPALHETYDEVRRAIGEWDTYLVREAGRLVGAVRGRAGTAPDGSTGTWWEIGRLCVAPDLQSRGLGRVLLDHIQAVAPAGVTTYWLFTGARSERNQRFYRKAGFRRRGDIASPTGTVTLAKPARSGM